MEKFYSIQSFKFDMNEEIKKLDHNTKVLIQEILHDYSSYLYKTGYADFEIIEDNVAQDYINENNLV